MKGKLRQYAKTASHMSKSSCHVRTERIHLHSLVGITGEVLTSVDRGLSVWDRIREPVWTWEAEWGELKKKKAVFTDGAYITVVMGISTLTLVPDHVIFLLLLYYPQCSHIAHTVFLLLFTPSLFLFFLPPCPALLLFLTLCFFFF